MEPHALIDVFDADGQLVQRLRVVAWPLRIGRGLDNDIVLDDPHVAVRHAEIAPDEHGVLWARDLGTINRLQPARGARPVERLALATPTTLTIGHSRLRLRSSADALPPERAGRRDLWLTRSGAALLAFAAVVALEIFESWLGAGRERDVGAIVTPGIAVAGVVLVWAAFWALIGRLVSKRAEYLPHLGIGAAAMFVHSAWNTTSAMASFAFGLPQLTRYGFVALSIVIAAAVFAHLNRSNPNRPRLFAAIGLAIGLATSGIVMLTTYEQTGRFAAEPYSSALYPPAMRIAPPTDLDGFLARLGPLAADTLADRRPSQAGDPGDDD